MEELRFIHAADLHLGSPFTGMAGLPKSVQKKMKDSTFNAFDRLVSHAVNTQPDFLLIAGDLYDGEDRSLRAQHRFQQGMQRLAEADIPVVLSYGNHDHLSGKWARFELPDSVFAFGPEVSTHTLQTAKGQVRISGFSYGERHVKQAMIEHYPEAEGDGYHIGMLHGSMDGEQAHAVYAPFTKQQLLDKGYDYWALGHIHLRQILHSAPPIVYPGNIQGRHRKESGAKGFYEVVLSKGQAELEFIPTAVVHFGTVKVPCSGIVHMNELLHACTARLAEFTEAHGEAVVDLEISAGDEGAQELLRQITPESLLETLRESVESNSEWVWIDRIRLTGAEIETALPAVGEKMAEVLASWELADWKNGVKELYRHPKAARFLEPLDAPAAEDIMDEAQAFMRRHLQERG